MAIENGISRRRFIISSITAILGAQKSSRFFQQQGTKIELTMKPEEAARYVNEEIHPRLARVVNGPSIVPGIQDRLLKLIIDTQPDGRILQTAIGGYHPSRPDFVAHLDYDAVRKKPLLMIFVPAVKEDRKSVV